MEATSPAISDRARPWKIGSNRMTEAPTTTAAAVSSRGERMRASGLLYCEVGLVRSRGVSGSAPRRRRRRSSCRRPRRHKETELDAEDGNVFLLHEDVDALYVAAAHSARRALAADRELQPEPIARANGL